MSPYRPIAALLGLALVAAGLPAEIDAGEPAEAAPTAAPAPAPPPVKELLAALERAGSPSARLATAAELAQVGPSAAPALAEFLARDRASSEPERRAVLVGIRAAVPDAKGNFRAPGRQKDEEEVADDNLDWLAKLVEQPARPGLEEVIADVAAVRALAAIPTADAGQKLFDFAFSDPGLIYRDECGRYLRKMMPYSLPALIRASEITQTYSSKRRYATYQLERMDRENPAKALEAAADDPRLQAEIFAAWRDTKARAPVDVILRNLDHVSPLVRTAAREAWLALVTGTPPPEAPKRRLQLPGGELTAEPKPLFYNSRQLAEVALARELERLYGTPPDPQSSLEQRSQRLFAYYDDRRRAEEDQRLEAARAAAGRGEWEQATAVFDRVLVEHPEHPARAEMAPAYVTAARALQAAGRWREAAVAFRKAHRLSPAGDDADALLAAYHRALGRALEAEGGDGSGELKLAAALQPEGVGIDGGGGGEASPAPWLLYGGAGIGALALLLLLLGLRARAR